jgi:hypothetical protein
VEQLFAQAGGLFVMLKLMVMMLVGSTVVAADNSSLGEGLWCWQPASGTVMFCDYSTFSTCMAANRGKEEGTCFRRS